MKVGDTLEATIFLSESKKRKAIYAGHGSATTLFYLKPFSDKVFGTARDAITTKMVLTEKTFFHKKY